ncbi:MAG: hypothetical protein RL571_440 [Pseudomonadota bacterium]|jgi:hypothetical protein
MQNHNAGQAIKTNGATIRLARQANVSRPKVSLDNQLLADY